MSLYEHAGYISRVELLREQVPSFRSYPFHLDAVRELDTLPLHPKVTFLVGENGTGKSTLIEAIAVALGFNPEGGTSNFTFETARTHSQLSEYLRPVRGPRRPKDGFFFRAESYYNLATNIEELDRQDPWVPKIIESYGGRSLHEQSHGESFFATFLHRFGGRGLYVLDEPEAALVSFQTDGYARTHTPTGRTAIPVPHRHPLPNPDGLPGRLDLPAGRRRHPPRCLAGDRTLHRHQAVHEQQRAHARRVAGGGGRLKTTQNAQHPFDHQ